MNFPLDHLAKPLVITLSSGLWNSFVLAGTQRSCCFEAGRRKKNAQEVVVRLATTRKLTWTAAQSVAEP